MENKPTKFKIPSVLYHGTRIIFDDFEPFSQFASKQTALNYLEKPAHTSSVSLTMEDTYNTLEKHLSDMLSVLHSPKQIQEQDTDPKILIPVQLTMHHPYHLKHSAFHFSDGLEGIIYRILKDNKAQISSQKATPEGDFIFKNPLEISHDDVCKELKMDTLFSITKDEKRNRTSLSKQRFIQFLEKNGYDGIIYDYQDHQGNEELAYAIFRKEQVLRLDKPNTKQQYFTPIKQEAKKIAIRYIKNHKERELTITEYLARLDSYSR